MPDDALSAWLREGTVRSENANGAPPTRWDDLDGGCLWTRDSGDGRARRRTWRLLALTVIPWLVVVGLVTAGWRPSQRVPSTAPPPNESTAHPRAVVAPQSHSAKQSTTLSNRTMPGSAARLDALDPVLGSTAAVAVQQALTGTDQVSNRSRYINLALPEAATWVGDVAIVDVAAVVLEGTGGRWEQPRAARYAVPLRVQAGVMQVLSIPWALPNPPQTAPGDTTFAPVNDRTLAEAADRALSAVGYQHIQMQGLARDPSLPGVLKVEVTAVSPGEGQPRSQEIWVSDQPSPTVLSAYPAARPGARAQPSQTTQGGAR
jgi:hypothetical protein